MNRIKGSQKRGVIFVLVVLLLFPLAAFATNPPVNILDSVAALFQQDLQSISSSLNSYAQRLFLGLAIIGLIWNCGFLILEKADLGAFFATFIRWLVFVGFFWWLTQNGPAIAAAIINSFAQIGASTNSVTGAEKTLGPSTPINMAMLVDHMVESKISSWHPVDSLGLIILDLVILLMMIVVAGNMLVTLATCWVMIYAGQVLLGFGAVKWTSDIAINYFRTVLGIAVTYMTMIILVAIGMKFFQQMVNGFGSSDFSYQQMFILIVGSGVLAFLVHKIPPLLGSMTGNNGGAHGSLGLGAAIGAAAGVAAAAVTAGGAGIAAQAAGAMGGGGGALGPLMNAMRAGSEASSGVSGGDGASMADGFGAANDAGGEGGAPLAAAMGESSGGGATSRPSSGSSFSSRARSFGQVGAAVAHAGVSVMDSAVGGSGYNGSLAPGRGSSPQGGSSQSPPATAGNASSEAGAPAPSTGGNDMPPSATDQPTPTFDGAAPQAGIAPELGDWSVPDHGPVDAAAEVAAFVNAGRLDG